MNINFKKIIKSKIILSIIVLLTIYFSLIFLKNFKYPTTSFMYSWLLLSIFLILRVKKELFIIIFFNIGIIIITLNVYFFYNEYNQSILVDHYDFKNNIITKNEKNLEYFEHYTNNEYLGWSLIPNSNIIYTKYYGKELILRVIYTIDKDGLRISPKCKSDCNKSLLFFGCSLTYGRGLQDNETYPYQIGLITEGNYKIYNFGVSGYGAQHFLMQIETGIVEKIVDNKFKPEIAFFMAIPDHIQRVAGIPLYVQRGPKFVEYENENLIYCGSFIQDKLNQEIKRIEKLPYIIKKINPLIQHISDLFINLKNKIIYSNRVIFDKKKLDSDIKLYVNIIKKSEILLKQKYPEIKFIVLLHGGGSNDYISNKIIDQLKKKGIIFDNIGQNLKNITKWSIHKYEPHPCAQLNEKTADYIKDNFLK